MPETLDAAIDLTYDSVTIDTATVESLGGGSGRSTNHPPVAADDKAYLPNYYPYQFLYEEAATTTDASLSDDLIVTTSIGEEGDTDPPEVTINVLANDTDPDGDKLIVAEINKEPVDPGEAVKLASGATVTLNQDGSLFYKGADYVAIDPVPLTEQDATLTANSDGSGELRLCPGEVLVDSFTYSAFDIHITFEATGEMLSDEATVQVVTDVL